MQPPALSPECQQIRATLVNDREMLDIPLAVQRAEWDAALADVALPPQVAERACVLGGVPGRWLSQPGADAASVLLYLHGGGYTAGSSITHRELAAHLCLDSGAQVALVDYRLAPEQPFPAALDDAVASCCGLLDLGIPPERLLIAGDSAGGGLALAALLRLRELSIALPAAAALLSPWADLALSGPSLQTRAAADPLCSYEGLRICADAYLAGADACNPLASPLYADLRGLPPLLIHAGDDEILLSDATRLAERVRDCGGQAALEIAPGLWHVWHAWASAMPEARAALRRVGAFLQQQLGRS